MRMRVAARALSVCGLAFLSSGITNAVPAPPSLNPPQVNGSTVTLAWSVSPGVSAFRLEAGTAPGLSNAASAILGAIGGYTATGVPTGVYYVRVRAIDGSGESAPSNEVTVLIGGGPAPSCSTPPGQPFLNTPTVNGNSVSFAWTPAATGCPPTSFTLHAGSAPGLSNLAIVNAGTNVSFAASAPSRSYYIRVYAHNAFGSSGPSNERTAVVAAQAPPVPPSGQCTTREIIFGDESTDSVLDANDCDAPHRPGRKAELFTFRGVAGRPISIRMLFTNSGVPNTVTTTGFTAHLILIGPHGDVVTQVGATNPIVYPASDLTFTLLETGQYVIEATHSSTWNFAQFPLNFTIRLR